MFREHLARRHEEDSLHGEPSHRVRAFGLGDIVGGVTEFAKDVGGVVKGIGEGVVDTATGLVDAVTHPVETVTGISKLITDPTEAWPAVWHGIVDPIVEDWQNGNPGEAIGRGGWTIFEAVFGAKGLTKIGKAGKVIKAAPDVPNTPRPRTVPKPDVDAPKPKPDVDVPKPKSDVDAPKPGGTAITPSAELLRRTFGELSESDAAFAKRLNVQHVFHGDKYGGKHVAPGSGTFDGVTVAQTRANPGRTWKADVTYRNADGELVTKPTTMFPKEWSNTEVLQSIRRANEHATPTGKTRKIDGRDIDILEGEDRGLKIVIHRDAKTGEVLSAHPKADNKAFTENPG